MVGEVSGLYVHPFKSGRGNFVDMAFASRKVKDDKSHNWLLEMNEIVFDKNFCVFCSYFPRLDPRGSAR